MYYLFADFMFGFFSCFNFHNGSSIQRRVAGIHYYFSALVIGKYSSDLLKINGI